MFTVHCPRHGREILLDSGRIRGLDTTPAGISVRWECWCGHVGTTRTGRPSAAPTPVTAVRPLPAPVAAAAARPAAA